MIRPKSHEAAAKDFSSWHLWTNRDELPGIKFPGIYVIAITNRPLQGKPFSWLEEICYIGMSCAVNGMKGRLKQFHNTITGQRKSHGGADRVRYKHQDFDVLAPTLHVAIHPIECEPKLQSPQSLRALGLVAQLEYEYLALYAEKFARLPLYNDKAASPKYSHLRPRPGRTRSAIE